MPRLNFAPVRQCSTGPTTGCWEQGVPHVVRFEGREIETRVFCKFHGPWIARLSGPGYTFEARKES